ncbi:unnamed protein product, partial [marine sediment metagenome]
VSFEPILGRIDIRDIGTNLIDWLIIGAETGNRRDRIIPQRNWIEEIYKHCRDSNIPILMKDNLKPIWGENLIQEFPQLGGELF